MRRDLTLAVTALFVLTCSFFIATSAHASATKPYAPGWTHNGDGSYTTCKPHALIYSAPYRVYNNAWLETRQCASSTGQHDITVTSNAVADRSLVVAYPSIRYGAFYTDLDPTSGLPVPIRRAADAPYAHVSCLGRHIRGALQCDVDAWFHPTASTAAHGTFELVVVNRRGVGGGHVTRIDGTRYYWHTWMTCQHLASGKCDPNVRPWRIFYAVRVHRNWTSTVPVGAFAHFATRHHLLPSTAWLGDIAYGAELWSGGRGLKISMTIQVKLHGQSEARA